MARLAMPPRDHGTSGVRMSVSPRRQRPPRDGCRMCQMAFNIDPPHPTDIAGNFKLAVGLVRRRKRRLAARPASPGGRPAQVCENCPPQAHDQYDRQCDRQSAQRTDGDWLHEGWRAASSHAARRPHLQTIVRVGREEARVPADAPPAVSDLRSPEAARVVPLP